MSDRRTSERLALRPLLSAVVLRTQSDERLAELAAGGSQLAFTVIVERYRGELATHARKIVRADRAEDVLQHAMLAAWTALPAAGELVNLRAWLHRIVHNAAINTAARRGYDDAELPEHAPSVALTEDLAEGRLTAVAALGAIAALPDGQREALTLTALEGNSGHDAALAMGVSESNLRQLVHRARSRVRSSVTAITPLPLLSWASNAAQHPASEGVVGVGAAGGIAFGGIKIAAVIGLAGAALGGAHALHVTDQVAGTNAPGGSGHATFVSAGRNGPIGQPAVGPHLGAPRGSSGNHTQPPRPGAAGAPGRHERDQPAAAGQNKDQSESHDKRSGDQGQVHGPGPAPERPGSNGQSGTDRATPATGSAAHGRDSSQEPPPATGPTAEVSDQTGSSEPQVSTTAGAQGPVAGP